MKTTATKWAAKAAGAGAMALLLAAPAFAQSRGDWNRNDSNRGAQATQTRADSRFNNNNNSYRNNSYHREDQHVTASRERDSYRGGFDRDRSYRERDSRDHVRFGISINLGGGYPYDNGYVRGVIDSVNYRTGTVWLRDDAGREIRAAVGGYALGDLHRGELVTLTGQWIGNGVFDVARIADIRY